MASAGGWLAAWTLSTLCLSAALAQGTAGIEGRIRGAGPGAESEAPAPVPQPFPPRHLGPGSRDLEADLAADVQAAALATLAQERARFQALADRWRGPWVARISQRQQLDRFLRHAELTAGLMTLAGEALGEVAELRRYQLRRDYAQRQQGGLQQEILAEENVREDMAIQDIVRRLTEANRRSLILLANQMADEPTLAYFVSQDFRWDPPVPMGHVLPLLKEHRVRNTLADLPPAQAWARVQEGHGLALERNAAASEALRSGDVYSLSLGGFTRSYIRRLPAAEQPLAWEALQHYERRQQRRRQAVMVIDALLSFGMLLTNVMSSGVGLLITSAAAALLHGAVGFHLIESYLDQRTMARSNPVSWRSVGDPAPLSRAVLGVFYLIRPATAIPPSWLRASRSTMNTVETLEMGLPPPGR